MLIAYIVAKNLQMEPRSRMNPYACTHCCRMAFTSLRYPSPPSPHTQQLQHRRSCVCPPPQSQCDINTHTARPASVYAVGSTHTKETARRVVLLPSLALQGVCHFTGAKRLALWDRSDVSCNGLADQHVVTVEIAHSICMRGWSQASRILGLKH